MNTRQQTAAVTIAVLAALVLAGCQSGGAGAAGDSGTAVPTTAVPTTATHSGAATPVSPVAPASGPSGLAGAPGAPQCHTAGLSVALGPPQGPADGQQTMSLTFTNTSPVTCSMYGFPGVNLLAHGIQWALERQSAALRRVVLVPGGHARSTLTLLRWAAGDGTSFAPSRLYVTPPDETTYRTLAWPPGVVLIRQDEATHPGTFIGPVS